MSKLVEKKISSQTRIGPFINNPKNYFCVGKNFHLHAKEVGSTAPKNPMIFSKANCISGPNDDIIIPKDSKKVDWECEIGVCLKEETYQIGFSGYDEVQAYGMAFGLIGERERPKEDFYESTNFNKLESSLPSDTIKVATYVNKKYSTKKIYFYVCSFTESTQRANHQEVYSLFSIMWSRDSLWELNPWYCCSVLSEEPQAPLHKEAANWMFKGVATTGCLIASVDDFKNGTLEIIK